MNPGRLEQLGPYIGYTATPERYALLVKKAFAYAVLSLPFTVNRMDIKDIPTRLANIAKGKLAEGLVHDCLGHLGVQADFDSCSTPFYALDRRDFLWNGLEWDIKNNLLSRKGLGVGAQELGRLPALVPNRFLGDQWGQRSTRHHNQATGTAFLFTFMVGRLAQGPLISHLLQAQLNKDQLALIERLWAKYKGSNPKALPFETQRLWDKWQEISLPHEAPWFTWGYISPIYLVAVAYAPHWGRFVPCGPRKFDVGSLSTRIPNMMARVDELVSFSTYMGKG